MNLLQPCNLLAEKLSDDNYRCYGVAKFLWSFIKSGPRVAGIYIYYCKLSVFTLPICRLKLKANQNREYPLSLQ